MKRSFKKFLAVTFVVATALMSLVACGGTKDKANEITVTFMNGETELGKVTAKSGETLKDFEKFEKVEGFEFLGWFETPTFLEPSKKDLATATFTEDTTLYGSFKSNNVTEDTRKWYVVGGGKSPVLVGSGWAGDENTSDAAKEACQLKPTGNATNEFSVTLDLFAEDKLQVIADWKWEIQKGFGAFTEMDETLFENGGGLAGSAEKSDLIVKVDGNYTITLTTDPDNSAQDTMTIVRNGDPKETPEEPKDPAEDYKVSEATGIVVKGSWVADWSENKDLTRKEGTNIFEITMELDAGTELFFMVYDNGVDTKIGMNSTAVVDEASKALLAEGHNIKVAEAGTYTFTVDAEALTVVITK